MEITQSVVTQCFYRGPPRVSPGFPLEACGNDGLREESESSRQAAESPTWSEPGQIIRSYTKYPPNTASFQVRRTDGAMPTRRSFSASWPLTVVHRVKRKSLFTKASTERCTRVNAVLHFAPKNKSLTEKMPESIDEMMPRDLLELDFDKIFSSESQITDEYRHALFG